MNDILKARARANRWYHQNKARTRLVRNQRSRAWYYANKARASENHRKWIESNRAAVNVYEKLRMRTDICYRLGKLLRGRIVESTGRKRVTKTQILLGAKIWVVKRWLELHFKPGMNWENYGVKGWHVDHVKPCASFDLSQPSEQRRCFHFTNLQPLWWHENLSKGAKP